MNAGVVAAVNMCNEWIPGSGRSELGNAQETNGGAVCHLDAKCILQELQDVDVGVVVINKWHGTSESASRPLAVQSSFEMLFRPMIQCLVSK